MYTDAPRARTRRDRAMGRSAALGTASVLAMVLLAGCTSGAPTPDGSATPTPTADAEGPRPTPSAAPAPQPVGVVIPGTCEELYFPDMLQQLEDDYPPLNDATMTDPNFSNVDELEELLRSLEYLQCTWGGASEKGIVTAVARVTPEQSAEALAIMESEGFDCYDQLNGTRCVTREDADGNAVGASHFLRDDIWLSTLWVNAPVRGYTENMIERLWP